MTASRESGDLVALLEKPEPPWVDGDGLDGRPDKASPLPSVRPFAISRKWVAELKLYHDQVFTLFTLHSRFAHTTLGCRLSIGDIIDVCDINDINNIVLGVGKGNVCSFSCFCRFVLRHERFFWLACVGPASKKLYYFFVYLMLITLARCGWTAVYRSSFPQP